MNALASTSRRIAALARRDARVELSYHFQLLLRGFTVLLSVLTFFFLGRLVGAAPELAAYEGGYFPFALIGLVMTGLAYTCISSFSRSISHAQNDGTFEILLATTTPLGTLMAGTLVVPFVISLADASLYLAVGWLLTGGQLPVLSVLAALPLVVLTLGTFCAVGLMSAAVIVLTKRGDPLAGMTLQASNLLAGALFPVALLPDALQVVSRLVPTYYGLNGIREIVLSGGALGDVTHELLVLTAFNVVMLPFSLWMLKGAIAAARVTGTLGNR